MLICLYAVHLLARNASASGGAPSSVPKLYNRQRTDVKGNHSPCQGNPGMSGSWQNRNVLFCPGRNALPIAKTPWL